MTSYEHFEPGEWVLPIRRGYKMSCCDCGLVHTLDFRVRKGRAQFCVFRDDRATAAVRRECRKKIRREAGKYRKLVEKLEKEIDERHKQINDLIAREEAQRG